MKLQQAMQLGVNAARLAPQERLTAGKASAVAKLAQAAVFKGEKKVSTFTSEEASIHCRHVLQVLM